LPPGWSSTTWITSNAGLPTPPADSLPNAAFVDDPVTISDKQLLSPNIPVVADGDPARVSFRNNFNLQDGFDGGVLEISFDDGLTFRTFLLPAARFPVAVTMGRSALAVAIPSLAVRRGLGTRAGLSALR
jgi:hypothetical protein